MCNQFFIKTQHLNPHMYDMQAAGIKFYGLPTQLIYGHYFTAQGSLHIIIKE